MSQFSDESMIIVLGRYSHMPKEVPNESKLRCNDVYFIKSIKFCSEELSDAFFAEKLKIEVSANRVTELDSLRKAVVCYFEGGTPVHYSPVTGKPVIVVHADASVDYVTVAAADDDFEEQCDGHTELIEDQNHQVIDEDDSEEFDDSDFFPDEDADE